MMSKNSKRLRAIVSLLGDKASSARCSLKKWSSNDKETTATHVFCRLVTSGYRNLRDHREANRQDDLANDYHQTALFDVFESKESAS